MGLTAVVCVRAWGHLILLPEHTQDCRRNHGGQVVARAAKLCGILFTFFCQTPPFQKEHRDNLSQSTVSLQPKKRAACNLKNGGADPRPHARSRYVSRDRERFLGPSHLVGPPCHAQRVAAAPARAGSTWLAHL